jgi:hypothetical protein
MDFFSKERSSYLGCCGYWDANILVLAYRLQLLDEFTHAVHTDCILSMYLYFLCVNYL